MADGEGNGDYYLLEEEGDFKRKSAIDNSDDQNDGGVHLNEKATEYLRDCLIEKSKLDRGFPIAQRLIEAEIEKVSTTGRIPSRDQRYADVYHEKPIRVSQKILVPVKEHPKFNFVGKLLGPKGNSLRRLQEETLCKMTVLGRNSMKDRNKEEELRKSLDPKYAHLNDNLHVEISTIAPPAEAYARMAYAMAELRKYLIPDSNDTIRQEQLRELLEEPGDIDLKMPTYKRGVGGGGISSSSSSRPSYSYRPSVPSSVSHGSSSSRTPIPPKQKVLSILDKARTAMDESYGRQYDDVVDYDTPSYDAYAYNHAPAPISRMSYDTNDYESSYHRRDYYSTSPSYPGNHAQTTPGNITHRNTHAHSSHNHNNINNNNNSNHHRTHVNR